MAMDETSSMEQWQHGAMAAWHNGSKAAWQQGSMAVWWNLPLLISIMLIVFRGTAFLSPIVTSVVMKDFCPAMAISFRGGYS